MTRLMSAKLAAVVATISIGVGASVVPAMSQNAFKSASEIEQALQRQEELLRGGAGTAACAEGVDCTRGVRFADPSKPATAANEPSVIVSPRAPSTPSSQGGAAVVSHDANPAPVTATRQQGVRPAVTKATLALPEIPTGQRLDLVILFEYDSAFIRPESRPQLSELCSTIRNGKTDRKFFIIGHTDATGSSRYNMRLSKARATEVKRNLVSECGVDGGRLEAVGMGEERLNPTFKARSQEQRRVEILLNLS